MTMVHTYSEKDLCNACEQVLQTGKVKAASDEWAVPYTTLRDWLKGTLPHQVAHQGQQWLLVVQEDHLAKWCLLQVGLGHPSMHA